MVKKVCTFLVVLFVYGYTALAATAETNELSASLLAFLDKVIYPLLAAFLTTSAGIVLAKLGKKYGVEASVKQQEMLDRLAEQAVQYVAEVSAARVKKAGEALAGKNEKLAMAVAHVLNSAPTVTKDQAASLVQAALARMPGVGATGDQVIR